MQSQPAGMQRFQILKSDLDDRDYVYLILDNGLRVVLVSDPETEKAGAALSVAVGSHSDPEELPGLAHFLEHEIFLGTEKSPSLLVYPGINDYSEYLANHGGDSNAFTMHESTTYYFEVAAEYLDPALDRFAQFFIAPLFSDEATKKELMAVESEFKRSLQQDSWRSHQLLRTLSNPANPYHKFTAGNMESLKTTPESLNIDVHQRLIEFYNQHYSANRMYLCIAGREPLEQLEKMAVQHFGPIKNKNIEEPVCSEPIWTENERKTLIKYKTVKDSRHVDIYWTVPPDELPRYHLCKPASYFSHLLGHEGKGSVLSYLKSKGQHCHYFPGGWALSLVSGLLDRFYDTALFYVRIDLTPEGLERYEEVISAVFQYFSLLKQTGPVERIFTECQKLGNIEFRFREKFGVVDYCYTITDWMEDYSPEELLRGSATMYKYEPEALTEWLTHLSADNFRIMVGSQSFSEENMLREKWFGASYQVERLPSAFIEALANQKIAPELSLPEDNIFLPGDFSLKGEGNEERSSPPSLIKSTNYYQMWHKTDITYKEPRTYVYLQFKSAVAYLSPLQCCLTRIMSDLLKEDLNEFYYQAEVAGIRYCLDCTADGIQLQIAGYSDKQDLLFERILEKISTYQVNPEQYARAIDMYRRSLENASKTHPISICLSDLTQLQRDIFWTNEEKLAALERLTEARVQEHLRAFFEDLFVVGFVHGNQSPEESIALMDRVIAVLKSSPLNESEIPYLRYIQAVDGDNHLWRVRTINPQETNSAMLLHLSIGLNSNFADHVHGVLLAQIFSEPFFNQLRTAEQLGYMVEMYFSKSIIASGICFMVQSEKDATYLELRTEIFLAGMEATLNEMSQETFNDHINSLIVLRTEKPKSLKDQSVVFWNEILGLSYEFSGWEKMAACLRGGKVTKSSLMEFYKRFMDPKATSRSKISIRYDACYAPPVDAETESQLKQLVVQPSTVITSMTTFRKSLGTYPAFPGPVVYPV